MIRNGSIVARDRIENDIVGSGHQVGKRIDSIRPCGGRSHNGVVGRIIDGNANIGQTWLNGVLLPICIQIIPYKISDAYRKRVTKVNICSCLVRRHEECGSIVKFSNRVASLHHSHRERTWNHSGGVGSWHQVTNRVGP